MTWKVVIAHAPGEEALAQTLGLPLQEAGYEVAHRGTVLVGESFTEEASKALADGGPVVLCATIKALGTGWAHRLINIAHERSHRKRIFAVRMEEHAYLDQIAADSAIAEYWRDPVQGIHDLLQALQRYYPLEQDAKAFHAEPLSTAFLDRPTGISVFNADSLSRFREDLRESKEKDFPSTLTPVEFLRRSGLMRNGSLTVTGVLLFGDIPVNTIPSARSRLLTYEGTTKGASREPLELRGTIIEQISSLHQQISSRIRTRERVRQDSPQSEVMYEYPMRTIREIIANALVHRDYEDFNRVVHVRLFADRIEILSPGEWMGKSLPSGEESATLEELVSESVKRNVTLASVVSWVRLVEGDGSGLVTAIEECRAVSAPIPTVASSDGFVKVTIYPRTDWAQEGTPQAITLAKALNQLPPPPADFVGREEELSELRKEIDHGATIVALRGLGGVGKTAIALKLASELQPAYPDGQIYLNLRGLSHKPLTPQEAMAHVVRSYHPEIRLPQSETELESLYRSLIHGRHVLLVLDDVASRQQVESLLPPPGNLLLMTSRVRFTLPGLLTKDVDSLSPAEARNLLLSIAPRIGDRAAEISRLCGYLPLALRLAASSLAERPDLNVDEYMQRMMASREQQEAITNSIRLSYDLLSPELQHQWAILSIFPSTFDQAAAVAAWDIDPSSADRFLGELLRNNLVEWQREERRYGLHSLLRVFAESRLEVPQQESARRRHALHYLEVLWKTSWLYEQGGEDLRRGLALFDLEWDNIQTGQSWAAAHSADDEEAARLCSDYPHAGAYFLDLRRHPRERIAWLESALEAAKRLGDSSAEAIHLGNLGNAYIGLGETRLAADLYEAWLETSRRIGDRRGEGQALGNLGKAYLDMGQFDRAIDLLEKWRQIAQEIGDQRGIGIALGNLGYAYSAMGDFNRAVEYYRQRLVIARMIGDRRGEGVTLGNLGTAYSGLGRLQEAIELYDERLAIAKEIGDRRGEGGALGNMGDLYRVLGDNQRASALYEQALPILREAGDRQSEAAFAWRLGEIYEQEGNLARAISWMENRVQYERETGHPEADEHALQVQNVRMRLGRVDSQPSQE